MNWLSQIITNIQTYIKDNGVGYIAANIDRPLREDCFTKVYDDMYNRGYIGMGVATTGTSPGVLPFKAFYSNTVSSAAQTYTGLGGIIVTAYKLGFFCWDGANWTFNLVASLSAVSPGAGDVVDDGGSSTVDNLVVENAVDGKHIIDSGIPKPGLYKGGLVVGAYSKAFAADTMILKMSFIINTLAPTIKIGTTAGADDISGGTFTIDSTGTQFPIDRYTAAGETIYYTLGGTGTAYIRIDYTNKMYLP